MPYQVVYDVQHVWYPNWWLFVAWIFFVSVGVRFFFLRNNKSLDEVCQTSKSQRQVVPVVAVVFSLLWLALFAGNYANYSRLRDAARNGKYEVVEGQVKEFVPMPYWGHAHESFVVNGQRFSYSDYDLTKGFNQTKSHGGPIREGLQVRIAHVNDSIVKLEIAR